jgi:hypothetical protein
MSLAPSFADTYKNAYSHGLEAIYAIETIDLKTVRPLQSEALPKRPLNPISKNIVSQTEENKQLAFDFGAKFSQCIESPIVLEPIHVLQLSSQAHKILLSHQKTCLQDLISLQPSEFVFFRGLGQGHIDEIQEKLHLYLKDHSLKLVSRLPLSSLIRILLGTLEAKKAYVFLEKFDLQDFLSLSSAETMEIRRLSSQERISIQQEILEVLKRGPQIEAVKRVLISAFEAFIKPWVQCRQGIVTEDEFLERLQRISDYSDKTISILQFLGKVLDQHPFPLLEGLIEVESTLYAADESVFFHYQAVVGVAQTYFYRQDCSYSLDELISLLQREFARKWEEYSHAFIDKVLTSSSYFKVQKNQAQQLIIKLA